MTNYEMTLNWLYTQLPMYQRIGPAAMKWSLDNIEKLVDHLGNPHRRYPIVHIAGTNGKGSVAHMLASILQEKGLKVGLHTSPHFRDFRERVKINGDLIPKREVIYLVDRIRKIASNLNPSFFEITVAMTFSYFLSQKVDVAVIETGLGGRLDSTNIVTPVLSIITGIHLDHQQFLGNTVEEIAREKAGIIKHKVPVVVGKVTPTVRQIFIDSAKKNQSPIVFAEDCWQLELLDQPEEYSHYLVSKDQKTWCEKMSVQVGGLYQRNNITTVLAGIEKLSSLWSIDKDIILKGLRNLIHNTYYVGRWQWIQRSPVRILCDSAHNAQGYKAVFAQIESLSFDKLHVVWGMVKEKEVASLLSLLPTSAKYYFCAAKVPRSIPADDLRIMARQNNLLGKSYSSVNKAKAAAIATACAKDLIFVGGSTFVVAEVL